MIEDEIFFLDNEHYNEFSEEISVNSENEDVMKYNFTSFSFPFSFSSQNIKDMYSNNSSDENEQLSNYDNLPHSLNPPSTSKHNPFSSSEFISLDNTNSQSKFDIISSCSSSSTQQIPNNKYPQTNNYYYSASFHLSSSSNNNNTYFHPSSNLNSILNSSSNFSSNSSSNNITNHKYNSDFSFSQNNNEILSYYPIIPPSFPTCLNIINNHSSFSPSPSPTSPSLPIINHSFKFIFKSSINPCFYFHGFYNHSKFHPNLSGNKDAGAYDNYDNPKKENESIMIDENEESGLSIIRLCRNPECVNILNLGFSVINHILSFYLQLRCLLLLL
jgi:hypothetical protein